MAEVKAPSSDLSLTTPDGSIQLSYIYKGECPDCKSVVETLEQDIKIENKSHHFVLAYCMNCKKQLKTREVVKLEEQNDIIV